MGSVARYNDDPFGRLDTVTTGGQVVSSNTWAAWRRARST